MRCAAFGLLVGRSFGTSFGASWPHTTYAATLFSLETKGEISEAPRARRLRINFASCCSAYALQRRWPPTAFEYCKKSCGIVFYSPRPSLESI
uniref:Putative secreted protein n=1 Tax=Anopheles triannulatus TaxID=58253 RepID=A0A2M4B563_9DIPT